MILTDFARAVLQLPEPKFRKILLSGIGLSIVFLVAIYGVIVVGLSALLPALTFILSAETIEGLKQFIGIGSFFIVIVLSFFLMVPVASLGTSFFLDDVAAAVEEKHYPFLPKVQPAGFWQGVSDTISFFGILVLCNMGAILVSLLVPVLGPFIFFATNGYLLGREYFQLVATRRLGQRDARALFATYRTRIWIAGCLMTLPLFLPVVNLLVPVLGAATFTHLFHRLWAKHSAR